VAERERPESVAPQRTVPSRAARLRPVEVLVVDDDRRTLTRARRCLQRAGLRFRLSVVRDGGAALRHLRKEGVHRYAPHPDLILLDLDRASWLGTSILETILGDPGLRRIPLVLLTVSQDTEAIRRAHGLHASCFIARPNRTGEVTRTVTDVARLWLEESSDAVRE